MTFIPFKKGDRVRCIDNSGLEYRLNLGETYTIEAHSTIERMVSLDEHGVEYTYRDNRFELVEETDIASDIGDVEEVLSAHLKPNLDYVYHLLQHMEGLSLAIENDHVQHCMHDLIDAVREELDV